MANITITNEDIEQIKKFKQIRDKGYFVSGADVTKLYNKVLHQNVEVTNCSSCIRRRIGELVHVMDTFLKQMELSGCTTADELNNEIKAIEEEIKEEKPQKKVGRKKKKEE